VNTRFPTDCRCSCNTLDQCLFNVYTHSDFRPPFNIGPTSHGETGDCNPDPVFSIPGFGIRESLIPGSRRDRPTGIMGLEIPRQSWFSGLRKHGLQYCHTESPLFQRHIYENLTICISTAYSAIVVMQSSESITRNSAVADKPRDAFVQIQRGWPPENMPSPYRCYHFEFGRFALKGVGIYRRTPIIGEP